MPLKLFKGFTLAEVLITLGIIGVVASLTIPGVMSAYNRHITETRLRGIYSTLQQAFRMYQAQFGDFSFTDSKDDEADVNGYSYTRSKLIFDTYFLPVFSGGTAYPRGTTFHVYSADGSVNFGTSRFEIYYVLNNGTVIGFTRAGNYDAVNFRVILNPQKTKLIGGKDVFFLSFRNDGNDNYTYSQLFKHKYDTPGGRDKLIEYCRSNSSLPCKCQYSRFFLYTSAISKQF